MAELDPENQEPKSFKELSEMADKGKLTENDMQTILHEYAASVREEFEMATAAKPDNAEEAARDFARSHQAESLAQIHWLSQNADSETTRLSACKYLNELAIKEATKDGDPILKLMKDLQAAPQKETAEDSR